MEEQSQVKPSSSMLLIILMVFVLLAGLAVGGVLLYDHFWGFDTEDEEPDSIAEDTEEPINGLIYLILTSPDEEIDGLLKWEQELNDRGLTALIKASKPVLEKYPEVFKRLSDEGHEIMAGNPDSCWDVSYDEQYTAMKEAVDYMKDLTGRDPQVVACKYSSYDENTVKVAEELGVPYLLARGTEDVRSMIYKPEEYDVKLLEVSNVEFGDMGRGSLCDISLYSRGSTAEDFAEVWEESLEKEPDSMIFVSHPHIGGVKKAYWEVYEDALADDRIAWRSFDDWMDAITIEEMAYDKIPVNTEVEYLEPQPAVPLDELEDLPDVGQKIVMFHNGSGPMCLDAMDFLETIDYPIEEHLDTESGFYTLLESYKVKYDGSEGVSTDFGYYPIIFIQDKAFSGFDDDIMNEILDLIE